MGRRQKNIPSDRPETWKGCKYLGSLLDIRRDITRIMPNASEKFSSICIAPRLEDGTKMKIFNTLIRPLFLFLYNSKIWTLTDAMTESMYSLHRRILRIAINVKYPAIVKRERVYTQTEEKEWSWIIKSC